MTASQLLLYATLRDDISEDELGTHLRELAGMLKQPRLEINIVPKALEKDGISRIRELENSIPPGNALSSIFDVMSERYPLTPIVLLCGENHPFSINAIERSKGLAQWGASNGIVSLVYGNTDKHVIWHETLHAIGAEDCYDMSISRRLCRERPNCIMQYEPTTQNVGDWPFICSENEKRIRDICSKRSRQMIV